MSRVQTSKNSEETRSVSPIRLGDKPPKTILLIRFLALGDVAITLPASASLRLQFPHVRIDFLTSTAARPLVEAVELFDVIHALEATRGRLDRVVDALALGTQLHACRYDAVIDLQRNWTSRLLRRMMRPKYWTEFDRFSPRLAGERVRETFHRLGLTQVEPIYKLPFRQEVLSNAMKMLVDNGWDRTQPLIVLNPAGLWETRNWPVQNYASLAQLWLDQQSSQFLLLGTQRILAKAAHLKKALGDFLINLVGKTTLADAFGILQYATLIISEDSGLMHMAAASGVPTVALFGSSNHVWSAPMGSHTRCLNSSDLPCAACMQPSCKYGDIHCLTRYSPLMVLHCARELLSHQVKTVQIS